MDLLWAHDDNLMIQEFLNGQEIGGDCYIDMISSELVSVFTKKKILMRAGETDKAVIQRRKTVCADREVCKGMRMERSD